jgi:hypothetical protein
MQAELLTEKGLDADLVQSNVINKHLPRYLNHNFWCAVQSIEDPYHVDVGNFHQQGRFHDILS